MRAPIALLIAMVSADPRAVGAAEAGEFPPAPAPAARGAPAYLRKIGQGDDLMARGDVRDALFAYQDAAAIEPTNPEVRIRLGDAYQRLGHLPQAIAQWEDALALAPSSPAASERLQRARAAQAARRSGAAGPGERREGAAPPAPAAAAPPVPTREPLPAAAYATGVALMARGLYAEALAAFDEAVGRDPKLAVARSARASARFGLKRYDEAAEDYRQALALDPALATPLYGLGECMLQRGDPAAAARYYEAYLRTPPTAPDAREDLRQVARRRLEETKR